MPAERLSMRKVLRLKHALRMSYRKISEATGANKTQAAATCVLAKRWDHVADPGGD